MSDDTTPACEYNLTADSFRHVRGQAEVDSLRPCSMCFRAQHEPEDFDADELLVTTVQHKEVFHRPLSSGATDRDAHLGDEHVDALARQMRDPEVTDISDIDFEKAGLGGSD